MTKPIEPVSIDGITFDALVDADETWQSDVPAYPTEAGFEVSDTIIIRSLILNLNVYLTNSPVTWKELHDEGIYRVQDVIKRLRELYFKKTPITVKTNEQDYENMAIVSIGLPTKIETGTSKLIPISLQQVMVTELQTAEIPASYGRGGATGVNAGTAGVAAMAPMQGAPSGANAGNQSSGSDGSRGSVLYNLAGSSGLLSGGNPGGRVSMPNVSNIFG